MNDNENNKKGFSGLSGLSSDIKDTLSKESTLKKEAKEVLNNTVKQEPQKRSESPINKLDNTDNSGGNKKFFIGTAILFGLIWFINTNNESNTGSKIHSSPVSEAPKPHISQPESTYNRPLQYNKPSIGTNNILGVAEIRWCLKEGIKMDAMRDLITSESGIRKFNEIVEDFNLRCGSYRYRSSNHTKAEKDIAPLTSGIIENAKQQALQIENISVNNSVTPTKTTLSVKDLRDVQQLLANFGYGPGTVDGKYGSNTENAIKEFQRDANIETDGIANHDLLALLRYVEKELTKQKNSVLEAENSDLQIPANSELNVYGNDWKCVDGYRKQESKCVEVQIPANAELNVYGNDWKCVDGYRKQESKCVEVQIPTNAELNVYGNDSKCVDGYRKQGSKCVEVQIPANAELNVYGNDWKCVDGYRKQGSKCVEVQIPTNAELNVYGNDWKCVDGYRKQGSKCVEVQIPANAELNVYGNDWKCVDGYRKQGSKCVEVQIPANAELNVYGSDWKCVDGYRKQGSICVEVQIPANAELNVYGNDWKCVDGYRKQGSKCVEVQIPANAELNVYGNDWKCVDGYKKQGRRCVSVYQ